MGSASDPYLLVHVGSEVFDDRDNYQDDEPNPEFYKRIEFRGDFPGCSLMEIKLMDYDILFGDDLIGSTKIDIEDRYFSTDWLAMHVKPIEHRKLYHTASKCPQGSIKMWLEINSTESTKRVKYDIEPKPPQEFEVRVVVWES